MSDIEKLFLAAYPLWPKSLLTKFSSLLSFEVAKFNPEINPQIIEQYKSLGVNQKIKIEPYIDNVNYLLEPSNASKISQVYYEKYPIVELSLLPAANPDWWLLEQLENYPFAVSRKKYYGKVLFDTRLFDSVSWSIITDYEKNPDKFTIKISDFWTIEVQPAIALTKIVLVPIAKRYIGASSVLAMIENGVSVDVDQKLISEFVTFLNAYNKYGGELAAANSLQAEKNRQTMTDYKNSISEKLNSRKNELNDLRTQISFAAKNETASAKRDMQSLTLSAQSLMLQLQDKLK